MIGRERELEDLTPPPADPDIALVTLTGTAVPARLFSRSASRASSARALWMGSP